MSFATLLSGVTSLGINSFVCRLYADTAHNIMERELRTSEAELDEARKQVENLNLKLQQWDSFWDEQSKSLKTLKLQFVQEQEYAALKTAETGDLLIQSTLLQEQIDRIEADRDRDRQSIELSLASLLLNAKATLTEAVNEWRSSLVSTLDNTISKRPELTTRLEKLREDVIQLAGRYHQQIANVSASSTVRSGLEPLVDEVLSIMHHAATEFAAFKVQYRNALNIQETLLYRTTIEQSNAEIAELKENLKELQKTSIPKTQHQAIISEFQLQKDEAFTSLVEQAQALESELTNDTDAFVRKLISQIDVANREISSLKERIEALTKPQTFTPATRDDLRMGNVVISYFHQCGIILDRAYSDYRGWEAVLHFHSDRNPRVIPPGELNKHSDSLQSLLNCKNLPKFEYDSETGILRLRVQMHPKPKSLDASDIHKLWKRADHFEAIVSKWERVRVTGGSESGKTPTAENIAVCFLKHRPGTVNLANPMDNSKKNFWSIPTKWTSHEESRDALSDLDGLIEDRANGIVPRNDFALFIFDEIDTTMEKYPFICGAVKNIVKQASHQHLRTIFIGQNANAKNYKKMDRSDWNNAVNVHIGSNAYDAITNSNSLTTNEQNDLKVRANRLTEFCEDKNKELGLDLTDPDAYRFAIVMEPNKKPYFIELPAFGRYNYDEVESADIRTTSVEFSDGTPRNVVQMFEVQGEQNSATAKLSTIPGKSVESDPVALCPDCGTESKERKGKPVDGKQRYFCRNDNCSKQTFTISVE
ncbi:hypothetical protein IQ268_28280 [Oculatella sp. LEGE 06141]|uniref:hypothetical protein n=1 Tax=Oculatella sp. LEGE 06141 TaxID=1828648 RepID=UPI00187F81E6|nr:hypothetical protein [Oculatella sp. LEGE 06141]MBE9182451.1 hypothetical protein [Oculatella sp. LEGE 06141]